MSLDSLRILANRAPLTINERAPIVGDGTMYGGDSGEILGVYEHEGIFQSWLSLPIPLTDVRMVASSWVFSRCLSTYEEFMGDRVAKGGFGRVKQHE